jgi:hypothetical protein
MIGMKIRRLINPHIAVINPPNPLLIIKALFGQTWINPTIKMKSPDNIPIPKYITGDLKLRCAAKCRNRIKRIDTTSNAAMLRIHLATWAINFPFLAQLNQRELINDINVSSTEIPYAIVNTFSPGVANPASTEDAGDAKLQTKFPAGIIGPLAP